MSTAIAFTPDPTVPGLRHDPNMQTRDAFTETKVVTLAPDFMAMAPHFSGGTQLLFKRIHAPADLVEGAVYALDQQNVVGYKGHSWYNQGLMGRLEKVRQLKRGHSLFADMYFSFDNPEAGAKLYGVRPDGLHFESMRFNKFIASKSQMENFGEDWVKQRQIHQYQLWQITHYVAPPAAGGMPDKQYAAESGISTKQQQWLNEEQQIRSGKAAMVTVRSNGLDYMPTLEQQLNMERADLVDCLLHDIPAITPGRAHRSKAAIVALTRRNCKRTITEFYPQEAVHAVLDLLDAMRREQAAMAILRGPTAAEGRRELTRLAPQLTTTAAPVRV